MQTLASHSSLLSSSGTSNKISKSNWCREPGMIFGTQAYLFSSSEDIFLVCSALDFPIHKEFHLVVRILPRGKAATYLSLSTPRIFNVCNFVSKLSYNLRNELVWFELFYKPKTKDLRHKFLWVNLYQNVIGLFVCFTVAFTAWKKQFHQLMILFPLLLIISKLMII